jgi:prepilin peptidase CpaA
MDLVPAYGAAAAAAVGAALDVRFRRIPNWLTGGTLLLGLLGNVLVRGLDGAFIALAGAALGLGLLLPFYAIRGMGAGDVKLLAGVGAIIGPFALVSVAVYGGVVGGLISLFVLTKHGRVFVAVQQALVLRTMPAPSGLKAPYGVAIAAGTVLSMLLPAVVG